MDFFGINEDSGYEIPKRFMRIWLGPADMPEIFEQWWQELKDLHPDYEFLTFTDESEVNMPPELERMYNDKYCGSYSAQSDILRCHLLYEYGGIYLDTDIMPLKTFDKLLENGEPFAGMRSSKSFEAAVLGSPKGHPAAKALVDEMPDYYEQYKHTSIPTGPGFITHVWFGRPDVRHLPIKTFYPYNGFGAPKRDEKLNMFSDKENFPPEMICAHLSNHKWGGNPHK